jgi:hypothetical protein
MPGWWACDSSGNGSDSDEGLSAQRSESGGVWDSGGGGESNRLELPSGAVLSLAPPERAGRG